MTETPNTDPREGDVWIENGDVRYIHDFTEYWLGPDAAREEADLAEERGDDHVAEELRKAADVVEK